MFRLIKLASQVFVGYALYEFFKGLTSETPPTREVARTQGGRGSSEQSGQSGSRMMSGGMDMQSQGSTGESMPHRVGRGVMPR